MQNIRVERALNVPNLLTMLRIGLLPAIVWRFRLGDMRGTLTLYLLAMLTDVLDSEVRYATAGAFPVCRPRPDGQPGRMPRTACAVATSVALLIE